MWYVFYFLPFEMHILTYYPPSLKSSSFSNGHCPGIFVLVHATIVCWIMIHKRSGFGVRQKGEFQSLKISLQVILAFAPSSTNLFPSVWIIYGCIEVVEKRTITPWTIGYDFPRPCHQHPRLARLWQLPRRNSYKQDSSLVSSLKYLTNVVVTFNFSQHYRNPGSENCT